jgi:hypothetical protein
LKKPPGRGYTALLLKKSLFVFSGLDEPLSWSVAQLSFHAHNLGHIGEIAKYCRLSGQKERPAGRVPFDCARMI